MIPPDQLLPWGDYRPDMSAVNSRVSNNSCNALPNADGYGPIKSIVAYTDAVAAAPRGAFRAKNSDGTVTLFVGTATKLYKLNNSTLEWENVSKTSGSHDYSLPEDKQWSFEQYRDIVIAAQSGDVPQKFDLSSDTYFSDLGGSPPTADFVTILGQFVVLSGIVGQPYRVQWSGRSDYEEWTSGNNESGYQDFTDGGLVYKVAGGEQSAVILQDTAMRRMTYQPGSPVIFSFERVSRDVGIVAPYSLIQSNDLLFWVSSQGFMMSQGGNNPIPIGKDAVDETWRTQWDDENPQLMSGFIDPRDTRVYWAFKQISNTSDTHDKIYCYDWALQKWGCVDGLEFYIAQSMSNLASTLDSLDTAFTTEITGDTNSNTTVDGIADTSDLYAGMTITGSGIPASTTIVSVDNGTTITISQSASATASGVTLTVSGALDAIDVSLDAFPVAFGREMAFFNTSNKLGFLQGDNLEATLESPEVAHYQGMQMLVNGCYPDCDADELYGQVSYRQHAGATKGWMSEQSRNVEGYIPARIDTRMTAFRNRIPAGATWTYSAGIVPKYVATGQR